MRRSTRAKTSETLEKLKNEEFIKLASDEIEPEDEYKETEDNYKELGDEYEELENDFKLKTLSNSPIKIKKRGRPRKSAPKPEDIINDEEIKVLKVETSSNSPKKKKRGRPRKYPPKSDDKVNEIEEITDANSEFEPESDFLFVSSSQSPRRQSSKKLKRTGVYVPPLETNPKDFMGKVISSQSEWDQFLTDQSSQIKRKNRRYKTSMINLQKEANSDQIRPLISSFNVSDFKGLRTTPARISHGDSTHELMDNSLSLSNNGTLLLCNTGVAITSVCFCSCPKCTVDASNVIIFVASNESILVMSAEVSNETGIKTIHSICRILPPETETFKSICPHEYFLSLSTNKGLYFLNCDSIHQQNEHVDITLCKSKAFPDIPHISCHSWRGNYAAVGTLSGRLHVFNPVTMNEVLQLSIVSNSAIYSLDWSDEHSILIGGCFSKIFSIDIRDPFIIETECSTLATLPKVVWSQALKSILFADGENHARRLEKSSINRLHQPLGTFPSMVHEMASSPLHNITATASSSGSIHLSWMPEESGCGVEFEKKILTIQNCLEEASSTSFQVVSNPEYVQFQVLDTIKLYPSDQACTSVSWCPNEHFPGLLTGGYRNGLLALMTTDQFFI